MIKSAPYYWLECDRCERSLESDYSAWSDAGTAESEAEESEWFVIFDKVHICPECTPGHDPDWDEAHEAFAKGETDILDCKWCKP